MMKLNPIAMGNALGGATAILFAICAVFVSVAREASITFLKAIVHGVDLTPLTTTPKAFDFGTFALGWVGMSIFLWIFGWLLGTIYIASTKNGGKA
jgi:hypothetical protein